jgi:hypothetical protein
MGAVYPGSLKMLNNILRCDNKDCRKVGVKMSETVISGSLEIWRKYAKLMTRESD